MPSKHKNPTLRRLGTILRWSGEQVIQVSVSLMRNYMCSTSGAKTATLHGSGERFINSDRFVEAKR